MGLLGTSEPGVLFTAAFEQNSKTLKGEIVAFEKKLGTLKQDFIVAKKRTGTKLTVKVLAAGTPVRSAGDGFQPSPR